MFSFSPSVPIDPSSASILAPYSSANIFAYFVFAIFCFNDSSDPSYIILVNPKSNALFISSKLFPWSKCTHTGTLLLSANATITLPISSSEIYLLCAALANCNITGVSSSSAASITANTPSSDVTLNAAIAISLLSAIFKIFFNVINIISPYSQIKS